MSKTAPVRGHRWQATLIVTLFFIAVAGAAAIGWWYARESPPHQGPIVVISVDGLPPGALTAYGAAHTSAPGIDRLAADAVVFDHAYAHTPQLLPIHATLFTGQLPFEHGVRDEAGFVLKPESRTLAELMRSRGFTTGAAVSSFLLRRETGVAQGFQFFDAEVDAGHEGAITLERPGARTIDAAEKWAKSQDGQRYFLFVEVPAVDADAAVNRLTDLLKARRLYERATIVLVGDRASTAFALDAATLRVPLLIKQPSNDGAGRHVTTAVQHIDLFPTVADLIRAPGVGGLHGRSLRPLLDDDDATLPAKPIYAESLEAYFRFGGAPLYASLTVGRPGAQSAGPVAPLAGEIALPAPLGAADLDRLALAGFLPGIEAAPAAGPALDPASQGALVNIYRAAARLVGERRLSAGVRALQAIAREHPMLAPVHYQLGAVLARSGRFDEAIASYETARAERPRSVEITTALADALLRAGRIADAAARAEEAVTLAKSPGGQTLARAHEIAARIALAAKNPAAAMTHADRAQAADPSLPVSAYVRGRLLYDEGKYADALTAFERAADDLHQSGRTLGELHFYLGETLARLERYADAEPEFREELRAFPHNIQAYTSLAMLYRASNRDDAVEDVVNELVESTPTPEGYALAARMWTVLGERSRAEALRSDARARFRGDPSLALLGRDARR